jgi:hypothetical protein
VLAIIMEHFSFIGPQKTTLASSRVAGCGPKELVNAIGYQRFTVLKPSVGERKKHEPG